MKLRQELRLSQQQQAVTPTFNRDAWQPAADGILSGTTKPVLKIGSAKSSLPHFDRTAWKPVTNG